MRINYKFHATAISVLCLLITALYALLAPKHPSTEVVQQDNGLAVEIYSATWGEECNFYIQDLIEKYNQKPLEKDANGQLIKQDKPTLVVPNNALMAVSQWCNGKPACDINPTADTIGFDPLPSCSKKLAVSYRCYSYDRLHTLSVAQGDTKRIDCNAPANSPTAGK